VKKEPKEKPVEQKVAEPAKPAAGKVAAVDAVKEAGETKIEDKEK